MNPKGFNEILKDFLKDLMKSLRISLRSTWAGWLGAAHGPEIWILFVLCKNPKAAVCIKLKPPPSDF